MTANGKRSFGSIRKLPSGRLQARYTAPDGRTHTAPTTFDTKQDAEAWLAIRRSEVVRGVWLPPVVQTAEPVPFADYADAWLAGRELKPRTRAHYRALLAGHIMPTFATTACTAIAPGTVRAWYAALDPNTPTVRAHAYALLRTILGTAVTDDLLPANPCRIRGAGNAKRVVRIRPASLPELEDIAAAMPERYRLMVLLASWCALRFGELTELRRSDVDTRGDRLGIRRGVVYVDGTFIVGLPKSEAGVRDVAIPPHLAGAVKEHLLQHTAPGRDGLLFAAAGGGHLARTTFRRVWYPARERAGRPNLRFHDLRHTGAVMAAATGATLAELMTRLGHATPAAAMRYQHASADRDTAIAAALSALHAAHTVRAART